MRAPFPAAISPQLCTLVDEPPAGKQWLHEIKFDGYRLIAFLKNGRAKLMTRGQKDWTDKFVKVQQAIEQLDCDSAIFDGEVVVLDDKHQSNFQLLQNALSEGIQNKFVYYIFDLLYLNGEDLRDLPLIERKKLLKKLLPKSKKSILQYSDHVVGDGHKVFQQASRLGLEGIVSKEADATYEQKRTRTWQKIKCVKRQEFVIGGFTKPKGARSHLGSLLIGVFVGKEFVYCGHVGTGFSDLSLTALWQRLKKLETKKMPFNKRPPLKRDVTWVQPKLVCEVEFTEWTRDGVLRHPSFKGLRMDKSPKKVIKEMPKPSKTYPITNPNKDLYPPENITKQDLAEYYDAVHKWILPYVSHRPLSLLRGPNGYKHCFYQKHLDANAPDDIHSVMIKEKNKKEKYSYIDNKAGLLSLVQLGVLEIHPWGSKIDDIEKPDILIFDLDPAPDVAWKKVIDAAIVVRDHLKKLKLKSFVKTTGGKGLHVVVPIKPELKWPEIKNFCRAFVDTLVELQPELFLSNMNKAKRKGKIFLDYLRNGRGATAVAAYSTRARAGATVSTPLSWQELKPAVKNEDFTVKTVPKRLAKLKVDPWKDFYKIKQKIKTK